MMDTSNPETSAASRERAESVSEARGALSGLQSTRGIQWAQALLLVALFLLPVFLCLRTSSVSDPDVWWHLSTAEWIVQHHALPHTDPFSIYGAGKPWVAYSWLYELLIFQLYQCLGLVGLVVFTVGTVVSIVIALHNLIRQFGNDFTVGVLLTAIATFSMARVYTPRPWLLTILFFVLELDLLMRTRKTGRIRGLMLLPLIFALWANIHIQFIGGLIVLGVALAELVLARRRSEIQSKISVRWFIGIFISCILATLANPYGWRVYQVAHELGTESAEWSRIVELFSLPFRSLDDWLVLFLTLAAVAVLARSRLFKFFESVLLFFAAYASFRSQRDLWVVVIVATLILAGELKGNDTNRLQLKVWTAPFIALATVLGVIVIFRIMHVDNARLNAELANDLPVRGVEVIRQNGWSGPLFNDFTWGGYLIWSLRMPVSIDGRTIVYGDQRLGQSYATWNALPGWDHDPNLEHANLVIGPVNAPLYQILRLDSHFSLVYEDKLAAIFIARKGSSLTAGESESGEDRNPSVGVN